MNSQHDPHSHLFLIRFWNRETGEITRSKELCGRVQHVLSGEARSFNDWPMLVELLLEMAETEGIGTRAQANTTESADELTGGTT